MFIRKPCNVGLDGIGRTGLFHNNTCSSVDRNLAAVHSVFQLAHVNRICIIDTCRHIGDSHVVRIDAAGREEPITCYIQVAGGKHGVSYGKASIDRKFYIVTEPEGYIGALAVYLDIFITGDIHCIIGSYLGFFLLILIGGQIPALGSCFHGFTSLAGYFFQLFFSSCFSTAVCKTFIIGGCVAESGNDSAVCCIHNADLSDVCIGTVNPGNAGSSAYCQTILVEGQRCITGFGADGAIASFQGNGIVAQGHIFSQTYGIGAAAVIVVFLFYFHILSIFYDGFCSGCFFIYCFQLFFGSCSAQSSKSFCIQRGIGQTFDFSCSAIYSHFISYLHHRCQVNIAGTFINFEITGEFGGDGVILRTVFIDRRVYCDTVSAFHMDSTLDGCFADIDFIGGSAIRFFFGNGGIFAICYFHRISGNCINYSGAFIGNVGKV